MTAKSRTPAGPCAASGTQYASIAAPAATGTSGRPRSTAVLIDPMTISVIGSSSEPLPALSCAQPVGTPPSRAPP
jgi:hypothetical protein